MKKSKAFIKIEGIKKVKRCIICGRKITISHLNQMKCKKCGYLNTIRSNDYFYSMFDSNTC